MPKKIATENINAKLGIVMRSGKALLGIFFIDLRANSDTESNKERTSKNGYSVNQLSKSA